MAANTDLEALRRDPELRFQDLGDLANIGGKGRWAGNLFRDLEAQLGQPVLSRPLTVQFPMKDNGVTSLTEQSVLLPHVLFSDIYHKFPATWRSSICPSLDELNKFWDEMDTHPGMAGNPLLHRPGYKRSVVPLKLHGDGVPVTGVGKSWCKMMDIFSWTSVISKGQTLDCTFGIWCCFAPLIATSPIATEDTLNSVFCTLDMVLQRIVRREVVRIDFVC